MRIGRKAFCQPTGTSAGAHPASVISQPTHRPTAADTVGNRSVKLKAYPYPSAEGPFDFYAVRKASYPVEHFYVVSG